MSLLEYPYRQIPTSRLQFSLRTLLICVILIGAFGSLTFRWAIGSIINDRHNWVLYHAEAIAAGQHTYKRINGHYAEWFADPRNGGATGLWTIDCCDVPCFILSGVVEAGYRERKDPVPVKGLYSRLKRGKKESALALIPANVGLTNPNAYILENDRLYIKGVSQAETLKLLNGAFPSVNQEWKEVQLLDLKF